MLSDTNLAFTHISYFGSGIKCRSAIENSQKTNDTPPIQYPLPSRPAIIKKGIQGAKSHQGLLNVLSTLFANLLMIYILF
jgi:hypothetical protein